MKKRGLGLFLGAVATGAAALGLASCDKKVQLNNDGEIFHIMVWNDEFKGFFEKYVSDEKKAGASEYHMDGKKVKFTKVPSDNGAYQEAVDAALEVNATAKESDKIDMFLAEADYILKYTDAAQTRDVKEIGVTDFSNTYSYTVEAASSSKGVVKGVSFQCCPAGVIYRRSIAKDLFGKDDPETVQSKISDWTKFNAVAAQAHDKGYYMTASFAETFRAFSNNVSKPWVNDKKELQFDDQITAWLDQAEDYIKKGYTLTAGVWEEEKTQQMKKDGKTLCFFGPAWYYNFCMDNPNDHIDTYGDWGLVTGPAPYFWGGTWMLAATGGDNDDLVAKTMNAFINDHDVCYNLVSKEAQFTNNQKVNKEYADTGKGNGFLGGQNDTALYLEGAKNIKFQNITIYDQYCNEGLQTEFGDYLKALKAGTNTLTREQAINNFKQYIKDKFPTVKVQ